MKIRMVACIVMVMVTTLSGCGSTADISEMQENEVVEESSQAVTTDSGSLDEIISTTDSDVKATVALLKKKYEEFHSEIDTYEKYKDGDKRIEQFQKELTEESEKLFQRIDANTEAYFRMALEQCEDNKALERAFDDYYDYIYDDASDKFYNEIIERLMDDYYNDYHDGIIDEASDKEAFKDWSDVSSKSYRNYVDTRKEILDMYTKARRKCLAVHSNMRRCVLIDGIRDYDDIMKQVEEEIQKKEEREKRVSEYVDYQTEYDIRDGKAYVTGISGEGNHVTIDSEYDECEVVGIDEAAFEGSNIQGVIFWADIVTIGDRAFKDCTDLTEISIPDSTELIGNSAFENCSSLESLIIWGSPDIGERAFANCQSIKEVSISLDTVKVCDHAFDGCSELESAIIWSNDTLIGEGAFANCPKLEKVPSESGKSVKLDAQKADETENEAEEGDSSDSQDGIRPEFQKAMDEYIEFFEEYCEFMETYAESDNAIAMLGEYTDYMTQYAKTMDALNKVQGGDLTKEEEKLYLDTMNTINKMLIDAM